MRPLPRLHVLTSDEVLGREDFGIRAAAFAAAGSSVALHARTRLNGARLAALTTRLLALARPPEAAVFVNGRADVARALRPQGVHLAQGDLPLEAVRRVLGQEWSGWVGRSIHSEEEARAAHEEGADYLMVGNVYRTESHPERPARGLELVRRSAARGLPIIAVGGVTAERIPELRAAGAWGVAVIAAAWSAPDPAEAARALLDPWTADG